MSKIVKYNQNEIVEPVDFDNGSLFARQGDDEIVGGVIAYPHHWSGFTVSKQSSAVLRLSPGRLFKGEMVYAADDQTDLNLQAYFPFVPGDGKWLAILARGDDVDTTDQRMVVVDIDVDTTETVQQTVPKINARVITYVVQQGIASPPPALQPSISDTECNVAFVYVTTAGIQTIVPGEGWRAKTLYEVEGRVTSLELLLADTIRRTSTLETDLANLAERMKMIPRPETIRQMQKDIAATRRLLTLPDEPRGYFYDAGLIPAQWDLGHANWLARVAQGLRHSWANLRDARIELIDTGNPLIRLSANSMCLPAWSEQVRIAVEGSPAGGKNIAQQVHTVVDAIQRTVSRSSTTIGPTVAICENMAEWSNYSSQLRAQGTFAVNGETFQSAGALTDPHQAVDLSQMQAQSVGNTMDYLVAWNADPTNAHHQVFAVNQVEVNSWSETYWDYVTSNFSVNGSVYAQSFLCATPMIATSIDLYFTRVGTQVGDVQLAICDLSATGLPQYDKVLAHITVTQANLAVGWVNFPIDPTLLEVGKRYAWFTVTTGNHALGFVGNNNPDNPDANKYVNGSMFWSTDGIWSQGAIGEDFMFRINAAKFDSARTVVEFQPLILENGMTEFNLKYPNWAPAGTRLVWEYRPISTDDWLTFSPMTASPMNGLPPLVQLRATFLGTADLAPMIQLTDKARSLTGRMRNDMIAVSKLIPFGFTSTTVQIETVVDSFFADHHTCTNKLVKADGTVVTASATTMTVDPTKASRRSYVSTFTLGAAIPSARIRVETTSDSVTLLPFVQNISIFAM